MSWGGHQAATLTSQLAAARYMLHLATLKAHCFPDDGYGPVVDYWQDECRALSICIIDDGCRP